MEGFVSFSTSLWFLPLTLLALGLVLVFLRPWSRGSARADGWRVPGEGVCPIAQCDFAGRSSSALHLHVPSGYTLFVHVCKFSLVYILQSIRLLLVVVDLVCKSQLV